MNTVVQVSLSYVYLISFHLTNGITWQISIFLSLQTIFYNGRINLRCYQQCIRVSFHVSNGHIHLLKFVCPPLCPFCKYFSRILLVACSALMGSAPRLGSLIHCDLLFRQSGFAVVWVLFHTSAYDDSVFPTTIVEENRFLPGMLFAHFSNNYEPMCGQTSEAFILFHWFRCLYLCMYQDVLITTTVRCVLKCGTVMSLASFLLFKIALIMQDILCFHVSLKNFFKLL